jgi:hypothetical protein
MRPRALVQKGMYGVAPADIRDLKGTVAREQAEMGVFITLEEPTRDMITEAVTAGTYDSRWGKDALEGRWSKHPRIQILTVAQLLAGTDVDMPAQSQIAVTFKRAPRVKRVAEATPVALFTGTSGEG